MQHVTISSDNKVRAQIFPCHDCNTCAKYGQDFLVQKILTFLTRTSALIAELFPAMLTKRGLKERLLRIQIIFNDHWAAAQQPVDW